MEDNEEALDLDIDELFKDPNETSTPNENSIPNNTENTDKDIMTKAVSERINSVKKKTENETQEKLAKELGYDSYADLQKANEQKIIKDAGLDESEISKVVEKLVEQRLANDDRLKKLEQYEQQDKQKFVENQLKEINKLTGDNFTSVDQLPKDTLAIWEKTGNLKQAYLATQGEVLLLKSQKRGSTLNHLGDTSEAGTGSKSRHLTESEKAIYRSVFPDITEDELSKKTTDIE